MTGWEKIIVDRSWLENAELELDPEDFYKVCGLIIEYMLTGEKIQLDGEDEINQYAQEVITLVQENEKLQEERRKYGWDISDSNKQVWEMAQTLPGTEIARRLGMNRSTLYHCDGWRQRFNPNYLSNEKQQRLEEE